VPHHVAVVPHTHWDREWYEPFDSFRLRLVGVLDDLLDLLRRDPSYRHFLLDGQLAMVDDYLEVRPDAEDLIRSLVTAERLTLGPWYVLADEFLVSGETLVRNLQLGMARAAEFGGAMAVGYLPDMFGHIAQMPQILTLAGMEHAVVWRGVPNAVDRTAFWWESPDGSTVRAEYLPTGYGNGAALPSESTALIRRVQDHLDEVGDFLLDGLLLMNGSDHQAPQPWLGRILAEANASQDDLLFTISSLPRYLAGAPTSGLPRWQGELRSGARANLLMGVISNRIDVKQAAAASERALERHAEPCSALFGSRSGPADALLAMAWKLVVTNAAHDSICACSVDEVVDSVLGRFARARAIADGITDAALTELGLSLAEPGITVVNLGSNRRAGLVEAVVTGERPPPHTQPLDEPTGAFGILRGLGTVTFDATTVHTVLSQLPSDARIDDMTWIHQVTVEEDATGIDVAITLGPQPRPGADVAGIRHDLLTRLGARPAAPVHIRLNQHPVHRVLALTAPVPGFGWQPLQPQAPHHRATARRDRTGAAAADRIVLSNSLVEVAMDPRSGTFAVNGATGFGRVVDQGDFGDSYNFSPPAKDRVVRDPDHGTASIVESGPLRAVATMVATYRWPTHVERAGQFRSGDQPVDVTTCVELRADDPVVRVQTSFVNTSSDHRVRLHFPLPRPAAGSTAECAFATVDRGLHGEGRAGEYPLATFPSRRFVRAGGLTLVHDGLNEYELVDLEPVPGSSVAGSSPGSSSHKNPSDDGPLAQDTSETGDLLHARTLAVTVLRSTGMLSRLGLAYRPLPAGPLTEVPGLQMLGQTITARYALCVDDIDPWQMAEDVLNPLRVVTATGGGWRPAGGQALAVSGAQVSAVRRGAGGIEVRVFNPSPRRSTVCLAGRSGWLVDLRGRPVEPMEGRFELRPFGIATILLPDLDETTTAQETSRTPTTFAPS